MEKAYRLRARCGKGFINLPLGVYHIGRDDMPYDGDVVSHVSRKHGSFSSNSRGELFYMDNSKNGTYVDGERVVPNEIRELHEGNLMSFGNPELSNPAKFVVEKFDKSNGFASSLRKGLTKLVEKL